MLEKRELFVKESTGLLKSVSLFDAIAVNVSYMSTGAALALIGFTVILLPSVSGLNLVYASLIGFLLSIPQIIVYSMMSRRVSRTGGRLRMDIQVARRICGERHNIHGCHNGDDAVPCLDSSIRRLRHRLGWTINGKRWPCWTCRGGDEPMVSVPCCVHHLRRPDWAQYRETPAGIQADLGAHDHRLTVAHPVRSNASRRRKGRESRTTSIR